MNVKHILCPVDFSRPSEQAIQRASAIARRFGSKLHFVHVYEPVFAVGFPAGSLVGYAAAHDIDLIVIGTHGRSGASRWLLGSVAEAVVRAAACPVLTVHDAD